jgi:hypothetical protein
MSGAPRLLYTAASAAAGEVMWRLCGSGMYSVQKWQGYRICLLATMSNYTLSAQNLGSLRVVYSLALHGMEPCSKLHSYLGGLRGA